MTDPKDLPAREILFFGGKGGVGKTTLAAAFAIGLAESGQKTLLVSTDPAHSTSDVLQVELGHEPRLIGTNCWAMEIDPAHEADRYIDDVKRRIGDAVAPRLATEVERQIDAARVSPGAEEAALFDRFARLLDSPAGQYDRIVFDTAPTGQTLRLLSLPELMNAWIAGLVGNRRKVNALGRMWRNVAGAAAGAPPNREDPVLAALEDRSQRFQRARVLLTDNRKTSFMFVLVPERLPILETRRAVSALKKYGIPVDAVFVNRVIPDHAEGSFLERRREREASYMTEIARTLDTYPLYKVPLSEKDIVGKDDLKRVLASVRPWS